ncbi:MAG: hypothetical protein M3471_08775, partial [Actinomycetota bacterium]|nr:hypothetical protein [Actinomycetota bacterium]
MTVVGATVGGGVALVVATVVRGTGVVAVTRGGGSTTWGCGRSNGGCVVDTNGATKGASWLVPRSGRNSVV